MAKLDEAIQSEIDALDDESNITYDNGDYNATIEILKKMWEKLPNPKVVYDDSYHIARFIALISLELKNFQQAKKWAEITKSCDPERQDIGEKEFLIGKVAYESGDMLEAKRFLKIANNKSGGRCFSSDDKKYKQLIK